MFRIGKSFEMQMSIFFFEQYVINSYSTNNASVHGISDGDGDKITAGNRNVGTILDSEPAVLII